jgi:hypothetical protein
MTAYVENDLKGKCKKITCPKCNSEFSIALTDLFKEDDSVINEKDINKAMKAFKEALRRYKDR